MLLFVFCCVCDCFSPIQDFIKEHFFFWQKYVLHFRTWRSKSLLEAGLNNYRMTRIRTEWKPSWPMLKRWKNGEDLSPFPYLLSLVVCFMTWILPIYFPDFSLIGLKSYVKKNIRDFNASEEKWIRAGALRQNIFCLALMFLWSWV